MARRTPPETCAQCGESIPPAAHACPSCGADERTGWDETSIYDGLDLPESEDSPEPAQKPFNSLWLIVGVGLIILLTLGAIGLQP